MAPKIQNKRSSSASNPPAAGVLAAGEIAINTNATTTNIHFEDAVGDVRSVGADPKTAGVYQRVISATGAVGTWETAGTPPSTGVYGYWNRSGTTLNPADAGDTVSSSGYFSYANPFSPSGASSKLSYYHLALTDSAGNQTCEILSSDGSASFDGSGTFGDTLSCNSTGTYSFTAASSASVYAALFAVDKSFKMGDLSGGTPYVQINASDGSATLAGGGISLNADGSAEFVSDVQSTSQNGGQLAGLRNLLINGDGRIAQRGLPLSGTTTSDSQIYTFDRWVMGIKAGLGWGSDVGTRDGRNTMIFNATGGNYEVGQFIELLNCWQLPNKVVTISYWAKAAATITPTFGMAWYDVSTNAVIPGTGAPVSTIPTYTTSWQYFSHTFTVPIGPSSYSNLYVLNVGWSQIPSGSAIEVQDVQIEEGPVATPFERRNYELELNLCRRYYESSFADGIIPGTPGLGVKQTGHLLVYGSEASSAVIAFKQKKRVEPAVVIYAPGTSPSVNHIRRARDGAISTISGPFITPDAVVFNIDSGASTGVVYQLGYTVDAEL